MSAKKYTLEEPHVSDGGRREWHNGSAQCCTSHAARQIADPEATLQGDERFQQGLDRLVRMVRGPKESVTFEGAPVAQPEPVEPVEPVGPQPVSATRLPVPGQGNVYGERGLFAGPPSLMPTREGVVELFDAVRQRRAVRIEAAPADAQFATLTTTQSGRPVAYLGGAGGPMPLRIADLVGLPSEDVGLGGSSAFPVFGAGAAATAAEGAAKTEYAAVTPGAATPTVLAVWTDMTAQVQSLANFETKLRNKLARLVAVRENELLRATAAGTAGIGTQAFTAGDQALQILRAAATLEAAVGVRPDLMLFNPADTVLLFGTGVSNAAPQELQELSMRMFGMLSLPLATQPAGFALVGAWAAASRLVVGSRLVYLVDPYTQMKNNIITVLAEEAVALAVEEPTGFTNVDIVTP